MTTSLEQKKLIACAELDGRLEEFESLIKQKYFLLMTETLLRENRFNYHTSLDAIVPVVVKWCGEDIERWFKFRDALEVGESSMMIIQYYLSASPSKILDALLLAAGKMPKE